MLNWGKKPHNYSIFRSFFFNYIATYRSNRSINGKHQELNVETIPLWFFPLAQKILVSTFSVFAQNPLNNIPNQQASIKSPSKMQTPARMQQGYLRGGERLTNSGRLHCRRRSIRLWCSCGMSLHMNCIWRRWELQLAMGVKLQLCELQITMGIKL